MKKLNNKELLKQNDSSSFNNEDLFPISLVSCFEIFEGIYSNSDLYYLSRWSKSMVWVTN